MTIASEISRLQTAKADICTAIENKGVTVGNITLDNYAACVDAIEQGGGYIGAICYLVVGGGGAGANGGGGGGDVRDGLMLTSCESYAVVVGEGGVPGIGETSTGGGVSCLGDIVANGGCPGCGQSGYGGASGSGCPGGVGCVANYTYGRGGGGGARGAGCNFSCKNGGNGGEGYRGYGGGGGGGGCSAGGLGCDGGGNGVASTTAHGCSATNCGGGGGGARCGCRCGWGGAGGGGVVDICFPPDGSWGISNATGGNCCYTCNGYCVHRFTSNGTFTIVS